MLATPNFQFQLSTFNLKKSIWKLRLSVFHVQLSISISKNNLLSEKVHGKIFVTGNTVIDAINQFSKVSKKYSNLSIDLKDYVLLTLHRSENVDKKLILSSSTPSLSVALFTP